MSTKHVRTTADLVRFRCALLVECTFCGNTRTFNAREVASTFGNWPLEGIAKRCRVRSVRVQAGPRGCSSRVSGSSLPPALAAIACAIKLAGMCNLYKMTKTVDEVARLFGAVADPPGNAGDTVYPGYPGLVVAANDGRGRRVRQMTWGFPLTLKGKTGQPLKPKPVNNCRTDKLDSFMWRHSFRERRCLIPVTGFCEAEGEKGAKTRTWFSLPDEELFAVAGLWRDTAEWGLAYSMVMTEACEHVAGVHDRMPAILPRSDWADWLNGEPDAAGLLCRPWELGMAVERTAEPWVRRQGAA